MTLRKYIKQVEKFSIDNSPVILTALGVAGTVTTAVLTGKASFKAARLIADEQFQINLHEKPRRDLDRKEKLKVVWKCYIPPVVTGSVTIGSIVMANHIGTKRAAAMAAAYAISEKAFSEYKDKVVEKIGENKERQVRDELAQDRVRNDPPSNQLIIADDKILVMDGYSGRYFTNATVEDLKKAENETNYQILHNNYASLTDFYNYIGWKKTSFSDEVGWNVDNLLELQYSTVLTEDGKPCLVVDFQVTPIRGFHRVH